MSQPNSVPSAIGDLNCSTAHLSAPRIDWSEMGEAQHFVQFYEDDQFLVESVGGFVGAGLGAGDAAIVIATAAHRAALEERLELQGLDLAAVRAQGRFVALDAAETLSRFMVDGSPDKTLFTKTVGSVVAHAATGQRGVRAFGEMVALLWAEGNAPAAIRLEELWNELARSHSFSLFCAYPMNGFRGASHGDSFLHICKEHSRVIPSESYTTQRTADDRLRSVSVLQQKASSLESEISERKHVESIVLAEQTKLTMAVAVAQLGIWELDMETNRLTCSDQCKANFGVTAHEPLTYESFLELIYAEDRGAVQTALRAAIADGTDYSAEYRVVHSGGNLRWIASMGRCFHNGAHRMLGVTVDVTERKRASELLEQTVAERTAKLQETVAELEAFSYSISHDMRSPLRAMHGYAKSLLDDYGDKFDSDAVTYLKRIQRASNRLDLLIRDVLAYSKVSQGQIELQPIALSPLVQDLLHQRPEFEIAIDCITIEEPLHTVMGHEAYLTQCLTNLIGNALKFVAPGEVPEVRIHAEEAGRNVRVWVCDKGLGIHPEHHPRMFQLFSRVYSEKRFEGTGMGLAIVKKAVARMGGEIGFQSEPGQGSKFWFVLPNAVYAH